MLVATVIAGAGVAFGVFIRHGRPEGIEDGAGSEVFGGNEDKGFPLTLDFMFLAGRISDRFRE